MSEVTSLIKPNDDKAALASRLPAFDNPKKTEYLVLRSVHFTHEEALVMCNTPYGVFQVWKDEDAVFAEWAVHKQLTQLQKNVGVDVLHAKFMRNVFLLLAIDTEVLTKRATNADELTDDERKELKDASNRYSAANINSMLKALEPEREQLGGSTSIGKLTVIIGDKAVEDHDTAKAAARSLLNQFTRPTDDYIDADSKVIE